MTDSSVGDTLQGFSFAGLPVRGQIAILENCWQEIQGFHHYPEVIRNSFGQILAANVVMSAGIKYEGNLILQVQGDGPMSMVVSHCTNELKVRGIAHFEGALPVDADMRGLLGDGRCVITVEAKQRYQGIVPLEGENLSQAFEQYYERSEQLPTRLLLVANEKRAAAFLIQRMPGESGDGDAWARAQAFAETLTDEELLSLSAEEIIHRLFHEEDILLHDVRSPSFECHCSRERYVAAIRSLGQADCEALLAEHGAIQVNCDFCDQEYLFDAVDVEQAFTATPDAPGSDAKQ